MGYTIFSVGDRVRIWQGEFAGLAGTVKEPILDIPPEEVIAIKGWSFLMPLMVSAKVDGVSRVLRVPPEFVERC